MLRASPPSVEEIGKDVNMTDRDGRVLRGHAVLRSRPIFRRRSSDAQGLQSRSRVATGASLAGLPAQERR